MHTVPFRRFLLHRTRLLCEVLKNSMVTWTQPTSSLIHSHNLFLPPPLMSQSSSHTKTNTDTLFVFFLPNSCDISFQGLIFLYISLNPLLSISSYHFPWLLDSKIETFVTKDNEDYKFRGLLITHLGFVSLYDAMALIEALYDILEHPSSMLGVRTETVGFLGPLWISFLIGLIIGWSWKPKWVTRESDKLASCVSKILESSLPSSPCRFLMSPLKSFGSFSQWNSFLVRSSNCEASWVVDNNNNLEHQKPSHVPPTEYEDCRYEPLSQSV